MKNPFDHDVHALHYVSAGLFLTGCIVFHSAEPELLHIIPQSEEILF